MSASTEKLRTRRPWWPIAAGAGVIVLVVALLVFLLGGDDDADAGDARDGAAVGSTSAAPTSSPATAGTTDTPPAPGLPAPGAPGPDAPAPDDTVPPPSLPQVGLAETAAVGDGVTVALDAVDPVRGEASGPGNIAGPALRVAVRITNGTGAEIPLDGVTVNLAYGEEVTPAPPLDDPSGVAFNGRLAAGGSAQGIYVFSVPAGGTDPLVVEVGHRPGAPLVLFVGPVG